MNKLVTWSIAAVACMTTAMVVPTAQASAARSGSGGDEAPIVVGATGDTAFGTNVDGGFEAGIYRFNKAGGLDGRKIKFVGVEDDGFNPQTALANTQKLVEAKHIMVSVPLNSSVADAATGAFLAQHGVPFIGAATDSAFLTQPKWGFGIDGNQGNPKVQSLNGMIQILAATGNLKTPGKVKMAFIAENAPGGIVANKALAGVAKALGIKVVYVQGPIPIAGTTNYAPYAQALMASGANVVYEVLVAGDAVGLSAALGSAGYKGKIVNGTTYFPGELAGQPDETAALQGVLVENVFPAGENRTPATKQAIKDLRATGQPPYLGPGVSVGYWSAIVFEQMLEATLKRVGGDPMKVTGPALQRTVTSGFTYHDPIEGGIGTVSFPAAETIPTGCGTLLKTVGTSFQEVEPFHCFGAIDIASGRKLDPITGKKLGKATKDLAGTNLGRATGHGSTKGG